MEVDLNADIGEGASSDLALLDLVSSANIACGIHAGSPQTMLDSVRACRARGVAIGAHPSFQNGAGFGRAEQTWETSQVYASVLYQVGALAGIARAQDARVDHVKPHGALYNQSARDAALADAVIAAIRDFDASLTVFALAGSRLVEAARRAGLACLEEAFADRAYQADATLLPRGAAGALLTDAGEVASRAVAMALHGRVRAVDGAWLSINAQTICMHGDHPEAEASATRVRAALKDAGVDVSRSLRFPCRH